MLDQSRGKFQPSHTVNQLSQGELVATTTLCESDPRLLVVPRRGPKPGTPRTTSDVTSDRGPQTGLTTSANMTVISQSKVFTEHLNKLRTLFN